MENKKISFAVIGGKRGEHVEDLIDEISKMGHRATHINVKELTLVSSVDGFDILFGNKSILEFDVFILRSAFRSLKNEVCIIANFLLKNDKVVIDAVVGENYIAGKVYESYLLSQAGIASPLTIQIFLDENKKTVSEKIKFPIIAKPIVGSKGRGVQKINNLEELEKFKIIEKTDKFFFQEYIPIAYDIRVFVVGDEVLGAMKRFVKKDDFRSNASLGSKVEKMELTNSLKEIALKAAGAYKYEVAGVDVVIYDGKEYILEVNNAPQWMAFKKVVGINPAKSIIAYAVSKYNNK
ncbi:MAG: RimK family alpha-L-glutamate ligase [Parcubacteria group bacterium]|jgi:RimK family alpha-L-glutamate ligase